MTLQNSFEVAALSSHNEAVPQCVIFRYSKLSDFFCEWKTSNLILSGNHVSFDEASPPTSPPPPTFVCNILNYTHTHTRVCSLLWKIFLSLMTDTLKFLHFLFAHQTHAALLLFLLSSIFQAIESVSILGAPHVPLSDCQNTIFYIQHSSTLLNSRCLLVFSPRGHCLDGTDPPCLMNFVFEPFRFGPEPEQHWTCWVSSVSPVTDFLSTPVFISVGKYW